jgi:NAD(P)-dependent dehydrogenase (short-subunit alcohol dehydrogenase family)
VPDVNFFGMVYGFWAALPHLKESKGTFLQVSSALAYRGIPLQAAYCSSKAAGRTFLESARVELEKEGADVAVSLVLPGAINTPQFDRDRQKIGYQPQPVPPIYQPEPFAEAVLHAWSIRSGSCRSAGGAEASLGPEEGRAGASRAGSARRRQGLREPKRGRRSAVRRLAGLR